MAKFEKFKHKKDPFAEREAQKYDKPIPSREFILEYIIECGPATQRQIQSELGIGPKDEQEALRRRLIAMARDGQLLRDRKGAFGAPESMELIAGRVVGHKDGFGFVVPDQGDDDLFISPKQMRMVFHGDRVLARVANIDTRGRREGFIVEVLEHNTEQVVGRFHIESGVAFVESTNQRISQDILISSDSYNGAKDGQMVVVGITSQPTLRNRPVGKIIEVLGDHMAPGMEINVAIRNHELPYIWPDDATKEASRIPHTVPPEAIAERLDFRHLPFVTIDGEDAKDFDDAVYCRPSEKEGFDLYVAIADVSYYVKPNSALDKEAFKRGNSVYFPGRVIPMLPEALSNNLCSLNSKVDRLVMVCEMNINSSGKITHYRFHEGVIQSRARLTYKEVHEMMEKNNKNVRDQYKELVPHLTHLYDIFHVLQKARAARGAIDFDLPETKIVFGRDRKIEKIIPYERFNSHRVIEECMLCANICAAKVLEKSKQLGLYRVHEGPTEEKLNDLRRFLNELGLKIPNREAVPADYAHILRLVRDRPDAHLIQTVLLRSMSQAVYSPENKGHFGLAYEAYSHFTSPIRRYPDLLTHRAIKKSLSKTIVNADINEFNKAGEHCSMTERRADDATNDVTDWLKCEFMMDKVGQAFSGVISGVTNFGLFVELADIFVEGLVHISTLPGDYYQFDPIKHTLQGERSGRRFRLGDPIKVQVVRVDLDQCEIDFMLAETLSTMHKGKKKSVNVVKATSKNKKNKKEKRDKKKKRNSSDDRKRKKT
jgi:ribonuclease R